MIAETVSVLMLDLTSTWKILLSQLKESVGDQKRDSFSINQNQTTVPKTISASSQMPKAKVSLLNFLLEARWKQTIEEN